MGIRSTKLGRGLHIPKKGSTVPKVGITTSSSAGLAGALFSRTQQRVLGLLFGQPDRSFLGAELIRMAGSGTGAAHRELTRLAASGLVTVTRVGNQKHYQANAASPVFAELCGLVRKTFGLSGPLQEALAPFADRIHAAFVYGSVARGSDTSRSDIDLMVIAEGLSYTDLYNALQETEAKLNRTIDLTLNTPSEWRRKLATGHSFTRRVTERPRLYVMGGENDAGRTR